MVYGLHFEIYRSQNNNQLIVGPMGFDDVAIPVENPRDAYRAATEWLVDYVDEVVLQRNRPFPTNEGLSCAHGGKAFYACTHGKLGALPAVIASDAAQILGVSRTRVGQLCDSGALENWKEDAHRMVTMRSIEARLAAMEASRRRGRRR